MGDGFSLSTEMSFIITFNLLILRDRNQLFELLCHHLTSIILAYREGIKEMTRCTEGDQEYYEPEQFLSCKLGRKLIRVPRNNFSRFFTFKTFSTAMIGF